MPQQQTTPATFAALFDQLTARLGYGDLVKSEQAALRKAFTETADAIAVEAVLPHLTLDPARKAGGELPTLKRGIGNLHQAYARMLTERTATLAKAAATAKRAVEACEAFSRASGGTPRPVAKTLGIRTDAGGLGADDETVAAMEKAIASVEGLTPAQQRQLRVELAGKLGRG